MAPKRRLGEILVGCGMIDEFQLRSALSDQKRWGRPLGVTLVRLGFVEEPELLRVLSRQLDTPVVDLQGKRIAPEALALLPVEIVEKYRCIPLFKKREGGLEVLYVGMEDPTDLRVADDLAFRTGLTIRCALVGPTQLDEAIERHYHKFGWDDDLELEGEAGFETPVEPGDTAPLILEPERPVPGRRSSRVMGPEVLESESPEARGGARSRASGTAAETSSRGDADASDARPPPSSRPESEPAHGAGHPGEASAHRTEPERAASPAAASKPREVPTRVILRAVTQLLVEKGVITRQELLERVRAVDDGNAPGAPAGSRREEL